MQGTCTRRKFLKDAVCLGGTVAAGALLGGRVYKALTTLSPEVTCSSDRNTESGFRQSWSTKELRSLKRNALIISGGNQEEPNSPGFYLDTLLWYHFLKQVMQVPVSNITVLHYDGRHPDPDLLVSQYDKPKLQTETLSLLSQFPPDAVPINGAATKLEVQQGLYSLSNTEGEAIVITSMHGGVEHGYAEDGSYTTDSVMRLLDGYLTNTEFAGMLENNRADSVTAFLMQCNAAFFLSAPEQVSNLMVLTSNGEGGRGEYAWNDMRESILWPWSETVRNALAQPFSDTDRDGRITLSEVQRWVLENDSMATQGWYHMQRNEQIYTHPGLSYGERVDPDNQVLLQYM